MRGQAQDLDPWRGGQPRLDYAKVLPFFKRIESYAGEGVDALRGEGPAARHQPEPRDPLFATIIEAAASRHPAQPEYNGVSQEGIAMSQATIAAGRHMGTARCYLDTIRSPGTCISRPRH